MLARKLAKLATSRSVSYCGFTSDTTDLTNYSFSSVSIGTAASSRYVVVLVFARGVSGVSVSSLTVGGVSATGYQNVAPSGHNSIWVAAVPSGTTATIEVNMSGACINCAIAVYALYNLTSGIPTSDNRAAALNTTASLSLTNIGGEIVIGGASTLSAVTNDSWTGINEQFDSQVESCSRGGGYETNAASGTYTVAVTISATANIVLVAAGWR
jgi:hypothetical protein